MKSKFENDVDALYRLPLAEFTAARNTLAARLKQGGRRDEADFVKALAKPSVSAWAVNQLYWDHRDAFNRLIATGDRFHKIQTSSSTRKVADMREALDARREALSHVSDLATELLRDAGHNPTQDTMLRVSTTLEALSVYASIPDGPRPGRLTQDVDPPGFDSLASFTPSSIPKRTKEPAPVVRRLEETRQAKIAAAKVSLQEARAVQKSAQAEAKDVEKRLENARAVSEEAARHVQIVAAELAQVLKAVEDAKRTVEKASKELEELFRATDERR